MKIAFLGTGRFGLPSLDRLKNSSHELICVMSVPDKAQGRNLKLSPSPVKVWALNHEITYHDYISHEQASDLLKSLTPDVIVVIAFGKLLPQSLIDLPRRMTINVHSSLLPKYRGAAPIHWAILSGDKETGVTVMKMNAQLDAGDILMQRSTVIEKEDDLDALEQRLSLLGAETLLESLDCLENNKLSQTPQNPEGVSYAKKISKEDGRVDWTMSASELENRVRAFRRWPVCHTLWNGKRLLILRAHREPDSKAPGSFSPGKVISATAADGLRVATGDGILRIEELQAEGRKPLAAADFLLGSTIKAGELLK